MLDPRNIHGVQVTSGMSVSLMNTGIPYRKGATKDLSRKIPDSNPELITREKDTLISATYDYIKAYQKTQHENTIN